MSPLSDIVGVGVFFCRHIWGLHLQYLQLLSKENESALIPGRSVLAQVSSIDQQKKRMIVTVRPADCFLPLADSVLPHMMLARNLADLSRCQKYAAENGSAGIPPHVFIS